MSDDEDSDSVNRAFHSAKLKVLPTEPWMSHGACKDYPTEFFYPPSGNYYLYKPAIRVCNTCIHKAECLQYALDHRIDDGVWGGTTGKDRIRLRRAQRLALTYLDTASSAHG